MFGLFFSFNVVLCSDCFFKIRSFKFPGCLIFFGGGSCWDDVACWLCTFFCLRNALDNHEEVESALFRGKYVAEHEVLERARIVKAIDGGTS